MQVLFQSRDPQGAEFREQVERRVRFVTRRLQGLVPRVKVLLSDVNGPRGGVDKRCQLALQTETAGTVVVSSTARTWRQAVDQALARAGRALRQLRQHTQARPHARATPTDI
ncbi:HPF/RaiA family ribosome-associated protein [Rhodoferax sp. WC2427]|uniref:HPF/RaiA family ribosome-associated protein n=1 Tax=Rhodoferax sp. WC2427 TaxID=3234144 RepID=UPI00346741F2